MLTERNVYRQQRKRCLCRKSFLNFFLDRNISTNRRQPSLPIQELPCTGTDANFKWSIHDKTEWNFIMVIEPSGVQLGLKSYALFQLK